MRVVFLNGPPRAGKDTAAVMLMHRLGAQELKFSWPLKRSLPLMFGLCDPADLDEVVDNLNTYCREVPQNSLQGMTWRQAQIWLSEDVMKPNFGTDIFGRIAATWLECNLSDDALVAVSDSGFSAEAAPVIEHAGAENCLLLRIHRPGCDFSGDSRSYLDLPIRTVDLRNDRGLNEYRELVVSTVAEWCEKS